MKNKRLQIEKVMLVSVLPAVAGAVNASGLFVVGTYTSHATGFIARLGDEAAQGHWALARACLWLLGAFLFGAMVATVLVDRSARMARGKYVGPLCVEAGLLGFVALGAVVFPSGVDPYRFFLTLILCTSMGLQNAMVTRVSGAVVRTTHITGVLTDFGIELVFLGLAVKSRIHLWLRPKSSEAVPRRMEAKRLFFHFTILISFAAGCVLGPMLYLAVGPLAFVVPCVVLLGLAYLDARIGLTLSERDVRSWREIGLRSDSQIVSLSSAEARAHVSDTKH